MGRRGEEREGSFMRMRRYRTETPTAPESVDAELIWAGVFAVYPDGHERERKAYLSTDNQDPYTRKVPREQAHH